MEKKEQMQLQELEEEKRRKLEKFEEQKRRKKQRIENIDVQMKKWYQSQELRKYPEESVLLPDSLLVSYLA